MASFQAKISQEKLGKSKKKKKIVLVSSYLPGIENSKKIAKKFKNTIMASFQAKISWEWPKMRENKKNRSDQLLPDSEQRITKKQQKNSKT